MFPDFPTVPGIVEDLTLSASESQHHCSGKKSKEIEGTLSARRDVIDTDTVGSIYTLESNTVS